MVVMNAAIIWDIAQCSQYVNRLFGGTYPPVFRVEKQPSKETNFQQMALKMGVIRSSETSDHIHITRRYTAQDAAFLG
jgi:hypothetical protein